MWYYDRASGVLTNKLGKIYKVYSGHGEGLDNPSMESVHDIGPLPSGEYEMTAIVDSPHTGPNTIILNPKEENRMFGRSGFRIHGDNANEDFSASNGCIILAGGWKRNEIWTSMDHELTVT